MWDKIGNIFCLPNNWASYPAPTWEGELIRIYYGSRVAGQTQVYYFDLDPKTLEFQPETQPVLVPGPAGTFDCNGVAPRCVVGDLMYIIGWNITQSVPYHLSIGVAEKQGGCWKKVGPVLDRNRHDPYFCTSPCVLLDNSLYKMWYCSCTGWIGKDPRYVIKYAESRNGFDWKTSDEICIGHSVNEAIGWPMVWKENKVYKMIFCHRGKLPYRLGQAASEDGVSWQVANKEPLQVSESGWDSEMLCYASVLGEWMFFNGNEYGKTGIGVARIK